MENNKMRKIERQMERQESLSLLQNGLYGVLATVDSNGQPYGVPLNYVFTANSIYFHCAWEGHKLENIKCNNKASFTVVGDAEILASKFSIAYESIILFGVINRVDNDDEKTMALMNLVKKYSPEFAEAGEVYVKTSKDKCAVFKIDIQSATGKHRVKS